MKNIKNSIWIALLLIMPVAYGQNSILKQLESEFVSISEKVAPSVVEISVEAAPSAAGSNPEADQLEELFRRFGRPPGAPEGEQDFTPPPRMRPRAATGTGFFYDSDGYIITNNHVVENARRITVHLSDGSEIEAEVVGLDPSADIAVIKIDPAGLNVEAVDLGTSDGLKVGQFAIAIGSARGQTGSISYGHISGLGRESLNLPQTLRFQNFIQTDAAINLGNSGGPLLNIDGEVIGVNVAIVYDANSIGFAIPIDRVKKIVPQLISDGDVSRGWLGVSIANIELAAAEEKVALEDYIEANDLPDEKGTSVQFVTENGPAEAAGVQIDDVIREVDGIPIFSSTDLINKVSDISPGKETTMKVIRRGKLVTLNITIGKFPGLLAARYGEDILGMHFAELVMKEDGPEALGFDEQPTDFYVVQVIDGSPAAEAGVKPGDIVTEVAHKEASSQEQFMEIFKDNVRPGKTLLLRVLQLIEGAEERKIYIKVPEDFKMD
jgi:serine protease Do